MKKIILLQFMAMVFFPALQAVAQTAPCNLVVTASSEPECLYLDKTLLENEYPDQLVACKQSRVIYTVHAYSSSGAVTSYLWEVNGDVSHISSGDHVSVTWGNDDWGMLTVTVVTSSGDTCVDSRSVLLVDIPTVGALTVPSCSIAPDGRKIIQICKEGSVEFFDRSEPGNSDIAGWLWECSYGSPGTTASYRVDNITSDCIVSHSVYNNCGCYDREEFEIEVLNGEELALDCYGTTCEGATVSYRAASPICTQYSWYVEGGTIVDGQHTDRPKVVWDHPHDGYGLLGLDGTLCDNIACPTLMTRRIPVMQDSLAISGQESVCLGESVEFTLPLFGSTEYLWSISPASSANIVVDNHSHRLRVTFNTSGTYTLECNYRCDFLDCGPYHAEPLTVTVNPPLAIEGNSRICQSNPCQLSVNPAVAATWHVYDMANGNLPVGTVHTGTTFSTLLSTPGNYLVTAEHASYCGPATFVLTVAGAPPAPTAADLDPANRHKACLYGGITLSGTPANEAYTFLWVPACTTATPQQTYGNEAAISYHGDVCNVLVYNYDRVLQCQSTSAYVHTVDTLKLDTLHLPTSITVCPGTLITWGEDKVPDQSGDGVLYEWKLQSNRQQCVSVQGSKLSSHITLSAHELPTLPATCEVQLTRRYCGTSDQRTVNVTIADLSGSSTLSISGPTSVCKDSPATFTGSGGIPATYRWRAEDNTIPETSLTYAFSGTGTQQVHLYSNPYGDCNNLDYWNHAACSVTVNPLPGVFKLAYDETTSTLSVVPAPSMSLYSFDWYYRANLQSSEMFVGSGTSTLYVGSVYGGYRCVVTDLTTGCSVSMSYTVHNPLPGPNCNGMTVTATYDPCSHTISATANNSLNIIGWHVDGGTHTITTSGSHDQYASIEVWDVGDYVIHAETMVGNCYEGTVTVPVDFIPMFSLEAVCGQLVIHNNSSYTDPTKTVQVKLTRTCSTNSSQTLSFPVSQASEQVTLSSSDCYYTLKPVGYGGDSLSCPICCSLSVDNRPRTVSISTANTMDPDYTCDNTPIELTASLSPVGTISESYWHFGDGSSFRTTGNSIHHTFKEYPNLSYSITITVTDELGCIRNSSPFSIQSISDPYANYTTLNALGNDVCPGNTRNVTFPIATGLFTWTTPEGIFPPPGTTHIYGATVPGDYYMSVIDNHYCQKEASTFVSFLKTPLAAIYCDNQTFCEGEPLHLYGHAGSILPAPTYAWSVSCPPSFSLTGSSENLTFTPPTAGTYTVTLTVTGSNGCSASDIRTYTVSAAPAAPTLTFGNPCIGNPPATLSASGFSGLMRWSNGNSGATASFRYPGAVEGWYFDPAVGCPSLKAQTVIPPAPDFDALLTGCYDKCDDFFPGTLPVYGLTDALNPIAWDWNYNSASYTTGAGTYFNNPLTLPLPSTGSYDLKVDYGIAVGASCSATSPMLTIGRKDTCECDSLDVSCLVTKMSVVGCEIMYTVKVTVCYNGSGKNPCIDYLIPLWSQGKVQFTGTDFVPFTLTSVNCVSFNIDLRVSQLIPSMVGFRLKDKCNDCVKDFFIDLVPDNVSCHTVMTPSLVPEYNMTNAHTGYYLFSALVGCDNVLLLRSTPPMVVNWHYDPVTGSLDGLGMVDMALLSAMADTGGSLCFEALVCCNDQLCWHEYCISAANLITLLGTRGGNLSAAPPKEGPPTLRPNPATSEVTVEGVRGEVVEVLVMDMHGRQVAQFGSGATFPVAALAAGSYIVRLQVLNADTGGADIHYLKLVKK